MLRKLTVCAFFFGAFASRAAVAQPAAPAADWKDWAGLVGEWEADPAADGATGGFILGPELRGRVLVRRSHADYPKAKERPGFRHEDLTVIHRDGEGTRADYWDSEGHLIRYAVTVEDGKIFTFLGEAVPGQPRFRLTYALTGPAALSLKFEIAPPAAPDGFKPYITATLHRRR